LAEFGTELPAGTAVRVHDSTADLRYMVLPMRPACGTEGWEEERLAGIVTRDSMIGVCVVSASPAAAALPVDGGKRKFTSAQSSPPISD
jgi:nitrile hydratase